MKRLIKKSFAVLSVAALVLAGCGKEDTQYGNEIGTVDGKSILTAQSRRLSYPILNPM